VGSAAEAGPLIREGRNGLLVGFRVSPSAAKTAVRGLYGERVKVSLSAPPEDGRANAELIEALARWLGLEKANIRIDSGQTSRDKVVAFAGIDEVGLQGKLATLVRGDRSGRS